jgi:hypothetical protein
MAAQHYGLPATPSDVLRLQTAIGNRAVAQMFRSAARTGRTELRPQSDAPIQRMKKRFRPEKDDASLSNLEKITDSLDSTTVKAHQVTLQALKGEVEAG